MSSDTLDPFFTPPKWAITCWLSSDNKEIFAILPSKSGPIPYIIKYPADPKGFAQVLHILKQEPKVEKVPESKLVKSKERQPNATEVMRERARQILKRKGIT